MSYPVITALQLRAVLRALRQSSGLNQAQVGQLLGVNQKRVAAIEKAPGVTGFDQISRLVAALGGRLVIEAAATQPASSTTTAKKSRGRGDVARAKSHSQPNW